MAPLAQYAGCRTKFDERVWTKSCFDKNNYLKKSSTILSLLIPSTPVTPCIYAVFYAARMVRLCVHMRVFGLIYVSHRSWTHGATQRSICGAGPCGDPANKKRRARLERSGLTRWIEQRALIDNGTLECSVRRRQRRPTFCNTTHKLYGLGDMEKNALQKFFTSNHS